METFETGALTSGTITCALLPACLCDIDVERIRWPFHPPSLAVAHFVDTHQIAQSSHASTKSRVIPSKNVVLGFEIPCPQQTSGLGLSQL